MAVIKYSNQTNKMGNFRHGGMFDFYTEARSTMFGAAEGNFHLNKEKCS
jgi:hypothetical protein